MIEWMGRYRALIEALVRHSNVTARFSSEHGEIGNGIALSSIEWQCLEYIYEHDNDNLQMSYFAERLGIAHSTFSKITKRLTALGLVDKYQMLGNKKNIILKPSQKGRDAYLAYSPHLSGGLWKDFFETMKDVPQESIDTFITAIDGISSYLAGKVTTSEDPSKKMILLNKNESDKS